MKSQRHISRKLAFQIIFVAIQRKNHDIKEIIQYILEENSNELESDSFVLELVQGIMKNITKLNDTILPVTDNKSLKTIDPISLSILYIGVYELCFTKEPLPEPIIINEAILLAKQFGKDTAAPLVNALLSKLVK